jgi:hypothetical protein
VGVCKRGCNGRGAHQETQDELVDQAGFEQLLDALRRERNVQVATALLSRWADEETRRRYEDLAAPHCEVRLSAAPSCGSWNP